MFGLYTVATIVLTFVQGLPVCLCQGTEFGAFAIIPQLVQEAVPTLTVAGLIVIARTAIVLWGRHRALDMVLQVSVIMARSVLPLLL